MVLPDLAVADFAERGVVRAEAAVDRSAALDHVGLAADQRQQRSFVGCETATADRRVENAHALRLRALVQRLDGIGLGGRRHRDDRARREIGEQPLRPEHDLVDLLVIADADDDEIGGARDLGRGLDRPGARLARLGQLLVVDVAGGHGVAVLDQVLEHGEPHASDPHDADALLRCICHSFLLGHARA